MLYSAHFGNKSHTRYLEYTAPEIEVLNKKVNIFFKLMSMTVSSFVTIIKILLTRHDRYYSRASNLIMIHTTIFMH